jgi:hypothetical protein
MTIHVPRWLLLAVVALIAFVGAAYGGYRAGDAQGSDDAKRNGSKRAATLRADAAKALLTHHAYELYILRKTCRYADQLRDPNTGQRLAMAFGCNSITPPPGDRVTIYGHDDRVANVLGQICANVAAAVTGSDPLTEKNPCYPDPDDVEPLNEPLRVP